MSLIALNIGVNKAIITIILQNLYLFVQLLLSPLTKSNQKLKIRIRKMQLSFFNETCVNFKDQQPYNLARDLAKEKQKSFDPVVLEITAFSEINTKF